MSDKIIVIAIIFFFGFAALILSKKLGSKSAELKAEKERVKNEAKQRQRANQIITNVNRLSSDSVADRLSNITAGKRK